MSNLSAAEIVVIGLVLGFLAVAIATSMKPRRSDQVALDSRTKRELQAMVEEIVQRHEMDPKELEALLERVVAAKVEEAISKLGTVAVAAKKAEAEPARAAAPAAAESSAAPATQEGAAAAEEGKVPLRVHLGGQVYDLQINPGENLLHAALDRNVELDYSCLEGNCDSCQIKVLKGREFLSAITPQERDMLDQDQLDAGERLACMVTVVGGGPVEIKQGE